MIKKYLFSLVLLISLFVTPLASGQINIIDFGNIQTRVGVNVSSATALTVGPNGTTNPTLNVITNTASGATGLSITNAAAGSGVTLTALSSGASDNLNLNAKGATGRLNLAATGGIWAANFIDVGTSGVRFSLSGNGLRSTVGGPFIIWGNSPQRIEIQNDTVSMLTVAYPGLVGIGAGTGTPTYGLHLSPTAGLTAGQTVFIQDATASTGVTRVNIKAGAGQSGTIFEIRDATDSLNASILDGGSVRVSHSNASLSVWTTSFSANAVQIRSTTSSDEKIGLSLASVAYISFSNSTNAYEAKDTSISKISAGLVGIGTGAQGSFAGSLKLTGLQEMGIMKFGGLTASFPALKRSTTELQVRLADDSAGAAFNASKYLTETNCADSAGAAACGSASAGAVVIDAAATTVVVSTTAVTANSRIIITEDPSLATELGVTCNAVASDLTVTARTAATSFTITTAVAPVTNPRCINYVILN